MDKIQTEEIQGFFVVQDEPFFIDKILVKIDGFFVTQSSDGFENGLIVGMMLSNSGII